VNASQQAGCGEEFESGLFFLHERLSNVKNKKSETSRRRIHMEGRAGRLSNLQRRAATALKNSRK
jgi:hypothetical protein